MNRDDITRMALEAGFTDADNGRVWITDGYWDDEIKRFAALVAAAEREQCVKIVMEDVDSYDEEAYNALRARAFAILERGKA
jgi:hypothetical protein